VVLSYWLERQLFGDAPLGYHVVNMLWHAAATAGVYACARASAHRRAVAFGGALLFAWFPPSAEAVAWIGGRPDPMTAACVFWALAIFLRACRRGTPPRPGPLVPLLQLAGLLIKEGAVVLPPAMLLAHRAYAARSWAEVARGWRAHAPTWGAVAVYLGLRVWALGGLGGTEGIETGPGMFLSTVGVYARLFLWPYAPRVALGPRVEAFGAMAALGALAICALAVALWRLGARAAPWAFWGLAILPVSNLAPLSLSSLGSERLAYTASAGWALGLALLWRAMERKNRGHVPISLPLTLSTKRNRYVYPVFPLFVTLCVCGAAVTGLRAFEWQSPLALWRDEAARAEKGVPTAHREWVAEAVEAGDMEEARAAVEGMDAHFDGKLTCETALLYAMAVGGLGEMERGARIHDEALQRCPELAPRGIARVREGAGGAGALVEEEQLGKLLPKWRAAGAAEAGDPVYAERLRAEVYQGMGMNREAESAYRRMLAHADTAEARTDLARFFLARGMYDDAARELDEALARDRDYPPAAYWKGFLLARRGLRAEAEPLLRRVLELDPEMPMKDAITRYLEGGEAP
jgi:tetratricopeptide (TPR) repeat protein